MTKDNHLLGKFQLDGIPPAPRGIPKIEVTFDIDANGILNVTAKESGSGKVNNITITNDKGRLSKADIERMLAEAEKYKDEDEKQRKNIDARNTLENYCFQVRGSIEDEKIKNKIEEDDRKIIDDKVKETLDWLDKNTQAEKDEYEHKQKDLSNVVNPIITKLYNEGGSTKIDPSMFNQNNDGPTIDEVD